MKNVAAASAEEGAVSHMKMNVPANQTEAVTGCLLGCAIGDSIGLPYEGLTTRRSKRFARLPLRQRFVFGHGMVSDDTDHMIFVTQALIRGKGDVVLFRRCLAWRLRLWLLCFPAGIGWATLKGIVRLWLGFSASGVFSAGNGPSMRSAIIGAAFPTDSVRRRDHVEASTLLTHTDPKALAGALAVAEVAARLAAGVWTRKPTTDDFIAALAGVSSEPGWLAAVDAMRAACESSSPLAYAQERFGSQNGILGFVLHSVPFALLAWRHHFGDYRATIEAVTQAGGDVDTVAAIAGALAGAAVGPSGIPSDWVNDIADWPHSLAYIRSLAAGLVRQDSHTRTYFSPWLFPRGIVFTLLVLAHGFRRFLPPY
jgi:ADP-ribosylglycohydrolase